ncbi:MAG: RsmB/NOP family class I SAM-dependent RNA methyltransferase [Sulfolobaceae archaeon]|nr:RsmB/NOP family class I SAM-dependent RNA methyltransferase [Sulfolobaceae archaeon]
MELEYDEFILNDLTSLYGSYVNEILEALKRPNTRYYVRVNTLKTTVDSILEKFPEFRIDEDFKEAIYTITKGPFKLGEHDTKVIVDKKTAESVMLGANVYKPGVKRILGKGKEVNVVSENGVIVAEGELVNQGSLIVKTTKSLYYVPSLRDTEEFASGLIYLQGKASMHVAHLLDPQPNELIIDMTAYPGGKLTHIYQLQPKSRVIGFDHTEAKVNKLKETLKRMGMDKIQVYKADSRYLYEDFNIKDVDKVIIDPPCSDLGVRPKIYDKKTKDNIMVLHSYQKQFLNSAYKILKKGGIVIYSTCTLTSWENEKVIEDPRFEVEFTLRFLPNIHDTTGFFIAKLRKK